MKIVYAHLRGREIYNACRNDYLHEISSRFKERWWTEEFDELRGLVLEWFTELYEENTGGHYAKLRESVLRDGFLNPIIVTSGPPLRREPWMVAPNDLKYLCEQNGGSRLALAQELDMELPCIVNGEAEIIDERFSPVRFTLDFANCTGVFDEFEGATMTGLGIRNFGNPTIPDSIYLVITGQIDTQFRFFSVVYEPA